MKRLIELIRKKNRARLERRALLRANGALPRGWSARLVYKLKAKNHARLAQRRLRKQLLASLAANDTAVLEALVFLLKTTRQDQRARAEAEEALTKRLVALEERVDAGVRLLESRLRVPEVRAPSGAPPSPPPADREEAALPKMAGRSTSGSSGVNGDLKHARSAAPARLAGSAETVLAEPGIADDRGPRHS